MEKNAFFQDGKRFSRFSLIGFLLAPARGLPDANRRFLEDRDPRSPLPGRGERPSFPGDADIRQPTSARPPRRRARVLPVRAAQRSFPFRAEESEFFPPCLSVCVFYAMRPRPFCSAASTSRCLFCHRRERRVSSP